MQSLKKQLGRAIERIPGYRQIERRLFFRHVKWLKSHAGQRLALTSGHTVQGGIFAGMKVHPKAAWDGTHFTVLSGQYESELYPIIQRAADRYDAFLDIGCANGFYAVGFAMISKRCDVIAYDIDEGAQRTTATNAELNGVSDRVQVRGEADVAELTRTIAKYGSAFILVDIEGFEVDLIDPAICPALRECDLLIEVHGDTEAVARTLTNRFSASHRATIVPRKPRNPFDLDRLDCTFEDEAWVLVSEGRTAARNNWLLLERHHALNS